MKAQRGMILTSVLFLMAVLSMQLSSLAFLANQSNLLSAREKASFSDFLKIKELLHKTFFEISAGREESFEDEFSDEAGRINLNFANEPLLKNLFVVLKENQSSFLEGKNEKCLEEILENRRKALFLSVDDVISRGMDPGDAEILLPYVTVYTSDAKINPLSSTDIVLKAVFQSMTGDDFSKDEILERMTKRIQESKKMKKVLFESDKDLEPKAFLELMDLEPTASLSQIANQITSFFSVETFVYRKRFSSDREMVFRHKGGAHFEILHSYGI